jgi:hypothetical protein
MVPTAEAAGDGAVQSRPRSASGQLMAYTRPMNTPKLLPLLFVALAARAEVYPEGYGDDRAAIVDLQSRYVVAMDYFDADGYAAVFAEDGVLDWAGGIVDGREAIREFMASGTYDLTQGAPAAETPDGRNWPSTVRHLITNQVIDVDGNTAQAVTYWIQFNNNQDRRQVEWMLFGSWYDEFVKIDGEWFFSLHRIFNEGNARTFTAGQENPVYQLDD